MVLGSRLFCLQSLTKATLVRTASTARILRKRGRLLIRYRQRRTNQSLRRTRVWRASEVVSLRGSDRPSMIRRPLRRPKRFRLTHVLATLASVSPRRTVRLPARCPQPNLSEGSKLTTVQTASGVVRCKKLILRIIRRMLRRIKIYTLLSVLTA